MNARPLGPLARFLAVVIAGLMAGCRPEEPQVVAYCAQDQVFAEPVFEDFHRRTGIRVRAVFDAEAVKTVGLANRLVAERGNPRCDVWWGNEEFRTRQLAAAGVFADKNRIWSFGRRERVLVVRRDRAGPGPDFLGLTNAAWRGRLSMAYPLFGTTATHLLALRGRLGAEGWERWCRALAANRPFVEEGNTHVVRRVERGEAEVGLTDTDDVAAAVRAGLAVRAIPLGDWGLAMPNTVALVRAAAPGSPAERLAEHLRGPAVTAGLVAAGALEPGNDPAGGLRPDWPEMIREAADVSARLEAWFRR